MKMERKFKFLSSLRQSFKLYPNFPSPPLLPKQSIGTDPWEEATRMPNTNHIVAIKKVQLSLSIASKRAFLWE